MPELMLHHYPVSPFSEKVRWVLGLNPNFRRPTIADGGAALHTYLAWLDNMLADQRPFLLGAAACIADFSAAQSVWFMHRAPPISAQLARYAELSAWYARVQAFGHGAFSPCPHLPFPWPYF